jgi:hypothetical protein
MKGLNQSAEATECFESCSFASADPFSYRGATYLIVLRRVDRDVVYRVSKK